MEILFYIAAFLSVYSYFIYPVILKLLPVRPQMVYSHSEEMLLPSLTLIITAHNEEQRIQEKLDNTLAINYPDEKLEIIVASDCSTDLTDDIVNRYAEKGVRLVRADERKGKEYAQLCAIKVSSGQIMVFSDVATKIPESALTTLAGCFNDPKVGAVSSADKFISNDGTIAGEGAYVKYEMWLRGLESSRAGLVGLSGSFFSARREVCDEWDIFSPSDFNTALNSARLGLVAITNVDVIGVYNDVKDSGLEYRRKVRTVIRGITAMSRHSEVLNPFSMGLFAFQVWSHKIMRWGVPWFMAFLLLLTLLLQGEGYTYTLALVVQLAFYLLAIAGWVSKKLRENVVIKIVFFFVQTNVALAQATISFLLGKRMTVWAPSKR